MHNTYSDIAPYSIEAAINVLVRLRGVIHTLETTSGSHVDYRSLDACQRHLPPLIKSLENIVHQQRRPLQ